jgi:hypothetical protein
MGGLLLSGRLPKNSLVRRSNKLYIARALNGRVSDRLHLFLQSGKIARDLLCAVQNCRQNKSGFGARHFYNYSGTLYCVTVS